MNIEDIRIYLPKFLSSESENELFNGLKDFPDNLDERLYSNYLEDSDKVYQGDGLNDLLVVNLPDSEIGHAPCMVVSNSCDIDTENVRFFPSQLVYSPIFSLSKYRTALLEKAKNKTKHQIDAHIDAIRKQRITQIFYLPEISCKLDDSIVFFDRVCNCPNRLIKRDRLKEKRIFTLSDFGAYLFLLKLSIHFTRIQDRVERRSGFADC